MLEWYSLGMAMRNGFLTLDQRWGGDVVQLEVVGWWMAYEKLVSPAATSWCGDSLDWVGFKSDNSGQPQICNVEKKAFEQLHVVVEGSDNHGNVL